MWHASSLRGAARNTIAKSDFRHPDSLPLPRPSLFNLSNLSILYPLPHSRITNPNIAP